ncbi:MAG: NADH-quinone oxidoreductase subunit M [Chthoniobacterales bacterium]|nr:NADH-quinone oxidoreductase subunit M [Chthoniobacterales bacterium]
MSPLLFLILIPFVAAIFMMVGAPARFTALLASGLNLILSLFLVVRYDHVATGWQYLQQTPVLPNLGLNFSLGADGLSLTMLLLTSLVSFAAIAIAPKTERFPGLFYSCLLLISGGLFGAFSSLDAFFLYGFHEIALIPVFIMIGVWGSGDRQAAAWKATLYLGAGSFVVLLGIIALYLAAPSGLRTFDIRLMTEMSQTGITHPSSNIYLLLLFGFGTLVSLFPFHSWAPTTYSSAPPSTAMLHAGVLKKFGLYGLLRLAMPIFPEAVFTFSTLLLILLTCNILYIGYVTIAQRRLDWTLSYSSVMHMGYIFLGLATMNIISLNGAALLMFAHGISVAALFALCGALRRRTGTLEYQDLGGLATKMPVMSVLFGFAAMASLGLPGFANFAGEILIFFGATAAVVMEHSSPALLIALVAAVWGVVLSAIYMLRAYRAIFFGPLSSHQEHFSLNDLTFSERCGVILLITTLIFVGVYPQFILHLVNTAIS